jgi:hypothetical protein
MIVQGDRAILDAHFVSFGDSANLDARLVQGMRRTYHWLWNCVGCTRWNSSMTSLIWNLFCPFGDSVSVGVR